MEKPLKIEITEVFLAKAGKTGWDKCFYGTIKRTRDKDGNPVVYGKIMVNNGIIRASAKDQWELGAKLDEMVLQALDTEYEEKHCPLAINHTIRFENKKIFLN